MVSSNVLSGAVYEAEFQAEALRRGFVPHVPCVPTSWDYLVTCPRGVLKVQVKGTASHAADSKTAYKLMTSQGQGKKRNIGTEVDVLACWLDPLRLWYLIPTTIRVPQCIRLYAGMARSSSRYEQYKDNWTMFYNH